MLAALFRLIAALPLPFVQAIGGALGRLVCWLSPTYRRRLVANIQHAGYGDRALIRQAAREAGKQALETPWIWMRPRADIVARTEVADMSVIDAALADGRPVMFLPPHLGSFEVTAQFYAAFRPEAKTRPMTVLY
ncbi:MAG: lysophospholipid acyltransferase family protein, partial [Burkholderiaceae bacterium]